MLGLNVFAITTSTTNYSGGVYNGDFEYAPVYVADTNVSGRWIDGTASGSTTNSNYGWSVQINSTEGYAKFNNVDPISGLQSIDINVFSVDAITDNIAIKRTNSSVNGSLAGVSNQKNLMRVKPNTNYRLSTKIRTIGITSVNSLGYRISIPTYDSSLNRVRSATSLRSNLVNGDVNTTVVLNFTTSATEVYIDPYFAIIGESGYVKIDDVRLEEVGTTSLVAQVTGRPSIVVTGVSDFNAIDQADTNNSNTTRLGDGLSSSIYGQCFTPTQNNFSGFVFQRSNNTGIYTGSVTISLRDANESTGLPIGEPLVSKTYSNAEWEGLTQNTDITVYLPYIIDANGTNKYCVDFNSSTIDANNYTRLRIDSSSGAYSGGTAFWFSSGVFTSLTTDMYFKTLFEKQTSAFDLNICSNGDSVCESKTYDFDNLNNGETYTITPANAPLFYLGDNNVYFMMHSDSDFNNKTPSMMAQLDYAFDAPTTNLTNQKGTVDNTRDISLACSNGLTGNCNNTLYSFNGSTYTTYTEPLTLNTGTYTLYYYSTGDNNNTESINTQIIIVTPQGSVATCSIVNLFPIILIFGAIATLSGIIFVKKAITENDLKYVINYILMLIIGIVIIINLLPIFC